MKRFESLCPKQLALPVQRLFAAMMPAFAAYRALLLKVAPALDHLLIAFANRAAATPYFLVVALAAWLGLSSGSALAAGVDVPAEGSRVVIGMGIQYLEDSQGTLGLQSVQEERHRWQTNHQAVFNQGYNASAWWLKFEIRNPAESKRWLLAISYAVLDELDVFVMQRDGKVQRHQLGDSKPFRLRPIDHRDFIVPVSIPARDAVTVFVRVKSGSSIQLPLALWSEQAFYSADARAVAAEGIYYGGLLAILLYNLILFFMLRECVYLYYVAYVASMFMFSATLNGWAFMFLWPEATEWNDKSVIFFLNALVLFATAFTGRLLDAATLSRGWAITQRILLILLPLQIVACLFLPYGAAIKFAIPVGALSCIWGFMIGVTAWRAGHSVARYYTLAWSALQMGGLVMAMNKFNLIPSSFLTDYSLQWASLLEVVLLSCALAERINYERAMRIEAQKKALRVQQEANDALEQRVAARTAELEEMTRRFRELSDTDQLTGLKNRRYLHAYLQNEFERCVRYKHPVAVIFMDVDHFKSINDRFGHAVGDACLVEVARRLRSEIRHAVDVVARYGGEEFCIVLPETDFDGVALAAERIRQKIAESPCPTEAGNLDLTVSIGVYVDIPSGASNEIDTFLARADEALYRSKKAGRNRATFYRSAESSGLGELALNA